MLQLAHLLSATHIMSLMNHGQCVSHIVAVPSRNKTRYFVVQFSQAQQKAVVIEVLIFPAYVDNMCARMLDSCMLYDVMSLL